MSKIHTRKPCFALVGTECSALKVKNCQGCSFYQTKDQARKARRKAMDRILSLEEGVKASIIEKYYDGCLED